MSAGPNGPCPYLGEPSVTRTRTRVLPFISRLPEPLGQVCVYYFRGCQCLWARPLHSHHILLRGYRLLVPSRPGLITYHIQVQYPLYPIYTSKFISIPQAELVMPPVALLLLRQHKIPSKKIHQQAVALGSSVEQGL